MTLESTYLFLPPPGAPLLLTFGLSSLVQAFLYPPIGSIINIMNISGLYPIQFSSRIQQFSEVLVVTLPSPLSHSAPPITMSKGRGVNYGWLCSCDGIGFPSLFYFYFYVYFMLKSFFVIWGNVGKITGMLVFLRHLDVSRTGEECGRVEQFGAGYRESRIYSWKCMLSGGKLHWR